MAELQDSPAKISERLLGTNPAITSGLTIGIDDRLPLLSETVFNDEVGVLKSGKVKILLLADACELPVLATGEQGIVWI